MSQADVTAFTGGLTQPSGLQVDCEMKRPQAGLAGSAGPDGGALGKLLRSCRSMIGRAEAHWSIK